MKIEMYGPAARLKLWTRGDCCWVGISHAGLFYTGLVGLTAQGFKHTTLGRQNPLPTDGDTGHIREVFDAPATSYFAWLEAAGFKFK